VRDQWQLDQEPERCTVDGGWFSRRAANSDAIAPGLHPAVAAARDSRDHRMKEMVIEIVLVEKKRKKKVGHGPSIDAKHKYE